MRFFRLSVACLVVPLALSSGCSSESSSGAGGTGGTGGERFRPEPYAANICIGDKQAAAGAFCEAIMAAWGAFALDGDAGALDGAIVAAGDDLDDAWDAAESAAQAEDADCANLALASSDAADEIEQAVDAIYTAITTGLDVGAAPQAQCASDLMNATGDACTAILDAEGVYISDLHEDPDRTTVDTAIENATNAWIDAWNTTTAGDCPTEATQEQVGADFAELVEQVVSNTITSPGVDTEYISLVPGETVYKGRTFTPTCIEPGSEYRYFARRGTVNKLVMYYQGGGACWDGLTCALPTCADTATEDDNPSSRNTGFANRENEDNPFKDWHTVFVSYCTCDVHFGDATQEYSDELTVEHRGYHNSQVVEKWAREHFYDPEVVFITGSSAGAYGAWFNAPLLHEVWPASQIHVLADAGNGVITEEFLTNEFSNWNFVGNLPEYIPGIRDALEAEGGGGMPIYTEAVATYFPESNWAHYSTLYDGGQGGQTGFYNVMLTMSPIGATTWWQASCDFGDVARQQSATTFAAVPENYRSYFGTGSAHTMWGRDKVYDDTTGGVPTVVTWLEAMLNSGPDGRDPDWSNVEASNPGLLLDGDPRPDPLADPFQMDNSDTLVVCE